MSFEDNVDVGKDNEFENNRGKNNSNSNDSEKLNDEHLEKKENNVSENNNIYDEKLGKSEQAKKNEKIREKVIKEEIEGKNSRKYVRMEEGKDDIDETKMETGRKGFILNPKFKRIVAVLVILFLVALALLLFSKLFGSNEENTAEKPSVENVVQDEETMSTDEMKQFKENSSGIKGQETSFTKQQESNDYENPNNDIKNTTNDTDVNETDVTQQQSDNIDAKEQESMKALEEMEKQINSDEYQNKNEENIDDKNYQEIEKPRKNRNSKKIEGADNGIAIYKGGMNDRMQYVDAKLQKESALNQMGISTKNGSKSNGTGGKVGGGIDINYQANETDKVASEMFGTDPTGVKFNGKVGGSAGMKTNRTPYYAYEKEEGLYDVFEGTIIPAVITNEINSDYPGRVSAIVREDVYDSLTGNFLLIPKGSKVMGDMIPLNTNGGLEKVATVWDRIILTNGDNIYMDKFRGQDLSGIDGIEGKVNKRYFKKISSIVASSVFEGTLGILSTLPEILLRKYDKRDGVVYSESGGRAGDRMGQSLTQIVDGEVQKIVTRPNTVTIKSGTKTNIIVNIDIRLPKFERKRVSK